ncbi:MAG: hypothetical protein ACK5LC_08750, partial [Coprobacillaceae bacterium]
NLKNIEVDLPLHMMLGIAGVSGSGKSSLINDTLIPNISNVLKHKCNNNDDEIKMQNQKVIIEGIEQIHH